MVSPSVGFHKCNVNAGFFQEQGLTTFGMCLTDYRCAFIKARTAWLPQCIPVPEGEATGLLEAANWVRSLGLQNIVFEIDWKIVVDLINSPRIDISELGSLIHDNVDLLSNSPNFMVSFNRRLRNGVTHSLARAAPLLSNPRV